MRGRGTAPGRSLLPEAVAHSPTHPLPPSRAVRQSARSVRMRQGSLPSIGRCPAAPLPAAPHMSFARPLSVALAIVGSVLTLAASAPRVFSPGYTYRLKIDGHVVEPNGKASDFVVLSGHAMVTEKGG